VIAAVGIVPVALYLIGGDGNELAVLSAPRIPLIMLELHFSWIAVGFVAAGSGWLIRHESGRIEFFVQLHVLRGMVVLRHRTPHQCLIENESAQKRRSIEK